MTDTLHEIHRIGLLPSVSIYQEELAAPLAKALCRGGLPCAEIIFRSPSTADTITSMKLACPDMIVGAAVSSVRQAEAAAGANAEFLVTSGFDSAITQYAREQGLPVIPAISSADKIEAILAEGIHLVKWFPSEQLGGLAKIHELSEKYPDLKFLPAGVHQNNLEAYIREPAVAAVSATWMIDPEAMATENHKRIEDLTRRTVIDMLHVTLSHAGLNASSEEQAKATADSFAKLCFGTTFDNVISYFGSPLIEVMKPGHEKGTLGHIGLSVSSTERAICYYQSLGFQFDWDTAKKRADGDTWLIYFQEEIAGFRVHLVSAKD